MTEAHDFLFSLNRGKARTKQEINRNLFPETAVPPKQPAPQLFTVNPPDTRTQQQFQDINAWQGIPIEEEEEGDMSFSATRQLIQSQIPVVEKPTLVIKKKKSEKYTKEELKELGLDKE